MINLIAFIQSRWVAARNDDRGATMAEYGLMIALVAVVAAVGATFLGTQIRDLFNTVGGQITP